MPLRYNAEQMEDALRTALETLAEEYPVESGSADRAVVFTPGDFEGRGYRIDREGTRVTVTYSDVGAALRAAGELLATPDRPAEAEETGFEQLGIMLDCSRNAVMQAPHFKSWLRRLALLGYNMAMLYTEDTYALEGEPWFGFQRGAYTEEELRGLDEYAGRLGIELVPCIQTLGHLAQILKWSAYADVRDTSSVLLVREQKTYALIEKMVDHWSRVFRSRRIHVGMDETHDLGLGRFLDEHGYVRAFDIFNEHVQRVVAICRDQGLEPMIWSDMYFRLGSQQHDYYDLDSQVPDDVRAAIPDEVRLVYWDYYHEDAAFYERFIEKHRELGYEPLMASGIWTWMCLWHAANYSEAKAAPCIEACKKAGLKELFFTLWGDDGGLCDVDSALQGLACAAEQAWSDGRDPKRLEARFKAVCHGDYEAVRAAGDLSFLKFDTEGFVGEVSSWPVLWDDPLLGLYWHSIETAWPGAWPKVLERYAALADDITTQSGKQDIDADLPPGDLAHAALLAETLQEKVDTRLVLLEAYAKGDTDLYEEVVDRADALIVLLQALDASYRRQWLRRNKPFGLEVIQIRIAGLIRRYEELIQRVNEVMDGQCDAIPELDASPAGHASVHIGYRSIATACHPGP